MNQLRIFAKELELDFNNKMVKNVIGGGTHNLKDRELNIENNKESSLKF